MDFANIKLNQLLDSICDETKVRIVKYSDDSIVMENKAHNAFLYLQHCDLDVVSIELHNNAIEVSDL